MAQKLDITALETYSSQYAGKLCDEFFTRNTVINGQQIQNLSTIGQVNTFVLSVLYEKWKGDAETFKSPYFNFDHESVKTALQAFMNTVSQQIAVKREDFEPLLKDATQKTLMLLIAPERYFDEIIRDMPDFTLKADDLKKITKYTRINKYILQELHERMNGQESIYVSQALNWLSEICEKGEMENTEKYFEAFSAKIPMNREMFFKKSYSAEPEIQAPNAKTNEGPKMTMTTSFFDFDHDDDYKAKPEDDEPLPTVSAVKQNSFVYEEEDTLPTVSSIKQNVSPYTATLNDNFHQEAPTVNEFLSKTTTDTLADYHTKTAINSIGEAISLNQKFVFIGKLFDGDIVAYNQSIQELDQCLTFGEAKSIMNKRLAPRYNWIMAAEEADDFLEITRRKFV